MRLSAKSTKALAVVAQTRAIPNPRDRRRRFADRISASMTPKPEWQPLALADNVAEELRHTGQTSLPDGSWARQQDDGSILVHTADGHETTIPKTTGAMHRLGLVSTDDEQMAAMALLHASARSTRRRSVGGTRGYPAGLWDAGLRLAMGGGGHTHGMGVASDEGAAHRGMNGPLATRQARR
jgi:hypothetical protein